MQYQEEQDYVSKFDFKYWFKLLKLNREYHKNLFVLAFAMCVTAAMDVAYPLVTRYAIDNFVTAGRTDGITPLIILYVSMVIIQCLCIFTFILNAGRVETGVCYTIRKTTFRRLQELPFSFYDKTPVGYMMARMTSDTQRLGDTIGWTLVDLLWGSVYIILTGIVLFTLNWQLALLVLVVIPPIAIISVWFQKRILAAYREVRKTNSRITGSFNEGIMGAKTTKTLVREARNLEEFGELTGTMKRSSIRAATLSALFMPIIMTIGSLSTAIALWRGGVSVTTGVLTLGTAVAFINYTVQFFEPVREVARIFAELQSSQASAERVLSLMETDPEIFDTPEVTEKFGDLFNPQRDNWPDIKGEIEFKDVTFKYKEGETVLEHFNLRVRAGDTIAIVGETGAGKSTLVNLVCRFYEPNEGEILIDGVDYRQRSQLWLQSHLGYVLQSPHLFSGTIRDNIRYGRLDATDAEVENAARMVGAEEFILKLEKCYDTDVGEGGNRLSTGEKQLISFARAILANPRIFVLDEATSSIDTETERLIQNAIQTVLENRTSFIIAHRLSTIRKADRILLVHDGKVVEEGTHKELLRKRGRYYSLYTNQFMEEQELKVIAN